MTVEMYLVDDSPKMDRANDCITNHKRTIVRTFSNNSLVNKAFLFQYIHVFSLVFGLPVPALLWEEFQNESREVGTFHFQYRG